MSKGKIFLIILGVILLAVVITAIVANQKYAFIFSSPVVSYEKLLKPETRAIIAVDPQLAKDIVAAQVKQVPAWVLPLALPYQAAFVIDMDYVLSDMRLKAFINDKRFGPIILERINSARLPAPLDQWLKDKMQMKEAGMLLREGTARLDRNLMNKIREFWKDAQPAKPLRLEGGHMVEGAIDNSDGSALAIMAGTSAASRGVDVTQYLDQMRMQLFQCINIARFAADVTAPHELDAQIILECRKDQSSFLQPVLSLVLGYLQTVQPKDVSIQGQVEIKGNDVVEGKYHIKNYEKFRIPSNL